MRQSKISKVISVICSIIGLHFSLLGLIVGLQSIEAPGLGGIGVIFLAPAIISFLVILFDFLITLGKLKKGLIFSCINSIIKIGIIACFIPSIINAYEYEIESGISNLNFYLTIITILIIITIPSILNTINFIKSKKTLQ